MWASTERRSGLECGFCRFGLPSKSDTGPQAELYATRKIISVHAGGPVHQLDQRGGGPGTIDRACGGPSHHATGSSSRGANLGFFAYALSNIADWVVAFEPNPDYAFFARWMLRGRAEVHQLALSDVSGRGTLQVPISDRGMVLHLAGSLKQTHSQYSNIKTYDVEVRTLDEFGVVGVRFIKADVEGSEREVLDGGRATIARDRPIILLEILSGTHEDPAAYTAAICENFGYEHSSSNAARRSQRCPRSPPSARIQVGEPTSSCRNVLFLPR